MKFGKVLTYKDIDEAKKLVGKKVVCSDCLKDIEDEEWCSCGILLQLEKVDDFNIPFIFHNGTRYQFIREVLPDKPEYEPYDLSDPKVRDSLRGRWYKVEDPDGTREEMVNSFLSPAFTKTWEVNGWDGEYLLKHCRWIDDGTPCGKLVNKEDENDRVWG